MKKKAKKKAKKGIFQKLSIDDRFEAIKDYLRILKQEMDEEASKHAAHRARSEARQEVSISLIENETAQIKRIADILEAKLK